MWYIIVPQKNPQTMIQKFDFHCPKCDFKLNQNNEIVLTTLRSNGDLGKMMMSTSVGNYSYKHIPEKAFDNGELVSFQCTNCEANLDAKEFEDYAQLIMKVDENIQFDILFSRRAGVQKTYLITEDGIETYSGT